MTKLADPFNVVKELSDAGVYYSLPELEKKGVGPVSKLPVSIRIVLESVLRNCGSAGITEGDVKRLANWNAASPALEEVPFVVSRIVLQDFTGVPLLVDLAAMRDAVAELNQDPQIIEPLVPVDLVVDHSVQVDRAGTAGAFVANLDREFERNRERYEFLKWGQQAFETFSVVPPAIGIVHQVNLEYLARVVFSKEINGQTVLYPDSLVGTDSHTTMINGLGIVGWGVGGIEAEAGMLGQPVTFQTPEVIGVNLTGMLKEGVTATDLTLRITELLRAQKVVGKFVEFYGEGAAALSLADRATIANMAPEYGATMGFFPVDDKSLEYLHATGRTDEQIAMIKAYLEAQGLFGMPKAGTIEYTQTVDLDLATIVPCVAGPRRPQDRIDLPALKSSFNTMLHAPVAEGGYGVSIANGKRTATVNTSKDVDRWRDEGGALVATETLPQITHGSVLIAAITSCTNTSNPSVMLAAGLLAKKAVEKGLTVDSTVKCSLAPGSRVVTDYLNETGLTEYLDTLGFNLVGYGCTTCIGNSGPLDQSVEEAIMEGELVTASVLSGNRNFEARVHGSIKANFLMSPPLVVAFALAGKVDIDLDSEPLGTGADGEPVYLKDIWPTRDEIQANILKGLKPEMFRSKYAELNEANPQWNEVQTSTGAIYQWDKDSTYIQRPPFFDGFGMKPGSITEFKGMRPMALMGDSVTTDHISPAGAIKADSPAGRYLIEKGVEVKEFNSYGSRRGNDRVMTRGTFANVRIRNEMAEGKEGGYTKLQPDGKIEAIYDAAMTYKERGAGLIVFGGADYGMGSSRDWAAKGTVLLGVNAVVTKSFERIHRSNLIGMGVLPLCFKDGVDKDTLGLDGTETFDLLGLSDEIKPNSEATLVIHRTDGTSEEVILDVRLDTQVEIEYYRNGGILTYVLRQLLD
ncbi:aconitate hydratase AcnA [Cerasicoccus arenae]|uniref:Aconitate hydratase n=1 Tax=Cerasicoccus arenae TaxID=424488 RepID=A0A8J3DIE3_9BACT|nr:aconitate hydratase AcnA [Cerasicoccus arenae]MBK1858101.1 aconitate hydratase AcnA [Cerasicoccus arenae]GHB96475.1 aconitate hydratase [Cerasicoccus arenae]